MGRTKTKRMKRKRMKAKRMEVKTPVLTALYGNTKLLICAAIKSLVQSVTF